MADIYSRIIHRKLTGAHLTRQESEALMDQMISGELSHPRIAAVLTALAANTVSSEEMTGFATVMRDKGDSVQYQSPLMDTCGTGGSGLETVNTSTMAAFVLSSFGILIAKHGNRASSGKCGSMDVLENLGVNIDISPQDALAALDACGVAFLFAPRYHSAVRHVVPVRKELGFRTVFNFLGPICNPANTQIQLLGVSDEHMAPLMLTTLRDLGSQRVMVVRGDDGLDELSLCASSQIWELRDGQIKTYAFSPQDIGLELVPFEAISGGDATQNTSLFMDILKGQAPTPYLNHLALNAGAGLYIAGHADSIKLGVQRALQQIKSGAVFQQFETYRQFTQSLPEHT